jgi:hypothetical protein
MESTPEIITALVALAKGLEELGLPGLIALLMLGPLMTVIAVFALDFFRQRHVRQEEEARRAEAKADRELILAVMERNRVESAALQERHRAEGAALQEQHRAETASILRDLGEKHAEVTQYYKDNVELLKTTQRIAEDLRDIIVANTRAFDRLSNTIEANFYCPVVREHATGKK